MAEVKHKEPKKERWNKKGEKRKGRQVDSQTVRFVVLGI
jgi:hypothetical protein